MGVGKDASSSARRDGRSKYYDQIRRWIGTRDASRRLRISRGGAATYRAWPSRLSEPVREEKEAHTQPAAWRRRLSPPAYRPVPPLRPAGMSARHARGHRVVGSKESAGTTPFTSLPPERVHVSCTQPRCNGDGRKMASPALGWTTVGVLRLCAGMRGLKPNGCCITQYVQGGKEYNTNTRPSRQTDLFCDPADAEGTEW